MHDWSPFHSETGASFACLVFAIAVRLSIQFSRAMPFSRSYHILFLNSRSAMADPSILIVCIGRGEHFAHTLATLGHRRDQTARCSVPSDDTCWICRGGPFSRVRPGAAAASPVVMVYRLGWARVFEQPQSHTLDRRRPIRHVQRQRCTSTTAATLFETVYLKRHRPLTFRRLSAHTVR
jgi:hypothetical protein